MKSNFKIVVISIVASSIIIAIISHIYITKYSEDAKRGELNWKRIKKVEIGMSVKEVNKIMNEPDTTYIIKNDKLLQHKIRVFSYYRGPGIYGYLQVLIDPKADTVVKVINKKE